MRPIMIAGCCMLVLTTLLINGSRAGLFIGLLAIGAGVSLYLAGFRREEDGHGRGGMPLNWMAIAGIVVASVLGAAALFANAA
jgi:hypothetical protein